MNLDTQSCDEDVIGIAIMEMLASHALTRDLPLKIRVENGWVELSGQANYNRQKEAAEEVVKAFSEIKGITNKIRVRRLQRI